MGRHQRGLKQEAAGISTLTRALAQAGTKRQGNQPPHPPTATAPPPHCGNNTWQGIAGSWAHMAMGSGGMAGEAASAEEPLGRGVDSRGDAQHRSGAEKRARRRARQRAKQRFRRVVELAGNDERGRRAGRVQFLESYVFSWMKAGRQLARISRGFGRNFARRLLVLTRRSRRCPGGS